MALFACAFSLLYVLVSVGALFNWRIAVGTAFTVSVLVVGLSSSGVGRFISSGFNYLDGERKQQSLVVSAPTAVVSPQGEFVLIKPIAQNKQTLKPTFEVIPYVFLLLALTSTVVVGLHLIAWFWLFRSRTGKNP